MTPMEVTYQLADIETIARRITELLESRTVLLRGAMGVGKTTFVSAMAKVLGSTDEVSSPTFSIVNEYGLPNGMLYHLDLYRISDETEALQFGIEEYLSSGQWIVMEWPERIPNLLPEDAVTIELTLNDDRSRTLKLNQNNHLTNKIMAKNCTD